MIRRDLDDRIREVSEALSQMSARMKAPDDVAQPSTDREAQSAVLHGVVVAPLGLAGITLLTVEECPGPLMVYIAVLSTLPLLYLCCSSRSVLLSRLMGVKGQQARERSGGFAASLVYLHDQLARDRLSEIVLSLAGLAYCLATWLFTPALRMAFPVVALVATVLLILRGQLLGYRIRKGYFGSNETEARYLMRFLMASADKTDFSDGRGRPLKGLLEEEEIEELVSPRVSEGATA